MPSLIQRLPAAAVLCLTAGLALSSGVGCSSTAYEREQQRLTELDAAMRTAAERLNAADLPAATEQLDVADDLVASDYERRKVESLRRVVSGAEALGEGDGEAAADEWSRIPSRALRYEIQEKAAGVGVQVPDVPAGG